MLARTVFTARTRCAVLLAAASCVLTAASASAGSASDPCALVAKNDAAKAMGSPVASVKPMTAGPSRSCSFHGAKPLQSVVVTVFPWGSPGKAHALFGDLVKQTAGAFSAVPAKLNGVGDEAATINAEVYARKGGSNYVFNVFGARTPALTARAVALAKATLARAH